MSGEAIVGILGVLLAILVGAVLVPLFLLFLYIKYRGGNAEMYQTSAEVESGKLADLLPWKGELLSELTRQWVGSSTYTVSMFGRCDQAAGRVPSTHAPSGWVLAFTMESKNSGADGRVLAITSTHRLELRVVASECKATLDGALLGTFVMEDSRLVSPDGAPLGSYRREAPMARLQLRGHEVATLDTRTSGALNRVESPGPLVSNLSVERSAEVEAWVLVAAVLELGWFGPMAEP